ncbi:triacylglycerol esterase/lipase EstA (alpha/beta hydrolase family) [Bacillus thermophilus]|uniref:Triacylglycerol esterase/lipase EstA (Alpha/beta hydrolase family) n=1 Tax=Siminovitchia thermophila TaxID=1245522 RepID=A0ABS2R2X8_9BACI|nr:hypothetical protein [Siminovitchia thermophila]MBM7713939.1 triacylglycerol esterase/lipase EstA (alpha/beta hydrolase family) [Siminovitchia thermophila]ONK23825.1 hypothetical protein BLX87_08180 [Bacillus sp. VT-16-64]
MRSRLLVMFLLGLFVLSTPIHAFAQSGGLQEERWGSKENDFSKMGKIGNRNNETPGEWFLGDTPPNPQPDAPVLLFVPGLNNVAQIFLEKNGLYQAAYEAGYETAFIQLYDAGGTSADMWKNGKLLAEKIKEISEYFNGKPITIIAYSKGGIDTQAAVTYYGAWPYVHNVITLSSPHHGSELADLANSKWAGWLADLLGVRGEGMAAVETGYMEYFRSMTDDKPYAYVNDFYTVGGRDWGKIFSPTWFGGVYLSKFGENDGVVTVASSRLPKGQEIEIGNWNHISIRSSIIFPVIEHYLSAPGKKNNKQKSNLMYLTVPNGDRFIQGNKITKNKKTKQFFPIETHVDKATLQLYTGHQLAEVHLVDPKGNVHAVTQNVTMEDTGIFDGAKAYSVEVENPLPGEWSIQMKSLQENAYLLHAQFNKAKTKNIISHVNHDKNVVKEYQLKVDKSAVKETSLEAVYTVIDSKNRTNVWTWKTKGTLNLSKDLSHLQKNRNYNITVDITGETNSGSPFKRTIIDSVYLSN